MEVEKDMAFVYFEATIGEQELTLNGERITVRAGTMYMINKSSASMQWQGKSHYSDGLGMYDKLRVVLSPRGIVTLKERVPDQHFGWLSNSAKKLGISSYTSQSNTPKFTTPQSSTAKTSNKKIGWGIGLTAFFGIGVFASLSGNLPMGYLPVYAVGAAVGVILLVVGIKKKKS